MGLAEKIYSIFALVFATLFLFTVFTIPAFQEPKLLFSATTVAFLVNIGLLFIIFRDVYLRDFTAPHHKVIWFILILFFWPSILFYLPLHGFKKRTT